MAGELTGQLKFEVNADGTESKIGAMKRDLSSLGRVAKEASDASAAAVRRLVEDGVQTSATLDRASANLRTKIQRAMADVSAGLKSAFNSDVAEGLAIVGGRNIAQLQPWIDALRKLESEYDALAVSQAKQEAAARRATAIETMLGNLRAAADKSSKDSFYKEKREQEAAAAERAERAEKALAGIRAAADKAAKDDFYEAKRKREAEADVVAERAARALAGLRSVADKAAKDDFYAPQREREAAATQAAARAQQALDASTRQLATSERELSGLRTAEQRQVAQDFLSAQRREQSEATRRLTEAQRELKTAMDAVNQAERGGASTTAAKARVDAMQQEVAAATAQASAVQRAIASGSGQIREADAFLGSLQRRLDIATKTPYQNLANEAKRLGLKEGQYKPLLDELTKLEKGFTGVGKESRLAAQQMALVAPQITDIITQLQMGTDPFTILIQQGGQLRDIFGSVGGALKGLGQGLLSLLTNPVVLAAAAVAALATAYAKGAAQSAEFQRTIVLTGNAAGVTEGQYNAMAKSIADATHTTIGSARESLQTLIGSGQLTGQTLQKAGTAVQLFSKVTGEGADAVSKRFAGAAEAPAKFAAELNKQYNILTAAELQHIKALEDQGRTQEALAKTFDALNTRLQDAAQHFGTLERWWDTLKRKGSDGIDFVLRIGRVQTTDAMLEGVREQIAKATSQPFNPSRFGGNAEARAQLPELRRQEASLAIAADEEAQRADAAAKRAQHEKNIASSLELQSQFLPKIDQMNKAIGNYATQVARDIADPLTDSATRAKLVANFDKNIQEIREKFKESKGPSTTGAFNDANRAEVEAVKQAEKAKLELIKRSQDEVALQRATGQINERDAVEENTRLELRALETRRDALLKEAAIVAKKKDATGEAAALTRQAAEIEDQITTAQIKGKNALIKLDYERAKAIKAVIAAQLEQAQTEELQGGVKAADVRREAFNSLLERRDALKDEGDLLQIQAGLLGQSNAQRKVAVEQARIQVELQRELDRLSRLDGDTTYLQDQARANATKEAAIASQRVYLDEWERTSEQVEQALTNALMDGGKSGADYIKGLFRSMVLKPVVQAIVQPIAGSIAGAIFGGGGGAGAGGTGSLIGNAGGLLNIFRGMGSLPWLSDFGGAIGTSVSNLGSSLINYGFASGPNSLASMGGEWLVTNAGTIGQVANNLGTAAGYLNSIYSLSQGRFGSAIGSAVGTYFGGPIGGLIGNTFGGLLDSVFGGGGTPHRGGAFTVRSDFLAGGQLANAANTPGFGLESGAFRSDRSAEVDKSVQSLVTGVASTIGSALTAFGLGSATVTGKFASDNDDASWGGLRIVGQNGRLLANLDSRRFNSDPQKGFEEFANQAGKTVRDALIAADLPAWADDILKSISDSAGIDAINQVVAEIKAISDASKTLAPALKISTSQFIELARAVGGASNASALVQGYIQAIFTDSEQLAVRQKVLAAAFKEINVAVPTSTAAYRRLVESQNLNTEAGRKMYLSLLQLAPVFGEIADAADELKNQAKGVIDEIARLRGTSDKDAATTQAQFAIKTAAARAGDKDALSELPGLSKAVEEALTATARSAADVASIRASLAASLSATLKALKVPGFADGGWHDGGWRVVGERGPELEYTPPARIFNNSQAQTLMDNSDVVAELRALREKLLDLEEKAAANAMHAARTAKLLERAMPDGDAIATRAAT